MEERGEGGVGGERGEGGEPSILSPYFFTLQIVSYQSIEEKTTVILTQ